MNILLTAIISIISAIIGACSKFGYEVFLWNKKRANICNQFSISNFEEKRIVVKILHRQTAHDPDLIAIENLLKKEIIICTCMDYAGATNSYTITPIFLEAIFKNKRHKYKYKYNYHYR